MTDESGTEFTIPDAEISYVMFKCPHCDESIRVKYAVRVVADPKKSVEP